MNNYERLLSAADGAGLIVKEKRLKSGAKGLIKGNRVLINKDILTSEKACALSEEIAHFETSVGNILNQDSVLNRKQERMAHIHSYNHLIGLIGIIECFKRGCQSLHESAEYLEVSEEVLSDALKCYREKFGPCTCVDNYVIWFEPYLSVFQKIG